MGFNIIIKNKKQRSKKLISQCSACVTTYLFTYFIIANHVANDNLFSSTSHLLSLFVFTSLILSSPLLSPSFTESVRQNTNKTRSKTKNTTRREQNIHRYLRFLSPESFEEKVASIHFCFVFFTFLIFPKKTKTDSREKSRLFSSDGIWR